MSQTRLVDFTKLSIEAGIAREINFDSVIRNLQAKKTEKLISVGSLGKY
jgi:hypothetical protein